MIEMGEECDDGDANEQNGCLSNCKIPTLCSQILDEIPGVEDGVYSIDPDRDGPNQPFDVYCDMTSDGGGWTLVGKVHRWHAMGPLYDEPWGWFAMERDTDALLDPTSYEDRQPGSAAHGQVRLEPAMATVSISRFTIIAENDPGQRATWFKEVDEGVWSWMSGTDHGATRVCTDVDLAQNCVEGKILGDSAFGQISGATFFEGMDLSVFGYIADGPIHMRHNEDAGGGTYGGVASWTNDANNNQWNDTTSSQWGNGLEIWFR